VADGLTGGGWRELQPQLKRPFFDGIRDALGELDAEDWPSLAALSQLALAHRVSNAAGQPIKFVAPTVSGSAMAYETQIATSGEIPTRNNLHDLFNALQWLSFPTLKAATNAAHVIRLPSGGDAEVKSRSKERDVLTMFDESGVIVSSTDASLLQLLKSFAWRTLFVERRAEVISKMRFTLVGHGLMEKALQPFVGMTGKAILLQVDHESIDDRDKIDRATAMWLSDAANLSSATNLSPLPLLGVPGWDDRNLDPSFYDNTEYFRPGRMRQSHDSRVR
jgi:hypothetical protein